MRTIPNLRLIAAAAALVAVTGQIQAASLEDNLTVLSAEVLPAVIPAETIAPVTLSTGLSSASFQPSDIIFTPPDAPEPSSVGLVALGLLALRLRQRRDY